MLKLSGYPIVIGTAGWSVVPQRCDTDLVSPNGGALGAGERDVHETLVVQQLAEDAQQVALMIVPP